MLFRSLRTCADWPDGRVQGAGGRRTGPLTASEKDLRHAISQYEPNISDADVDDFGFGRGAYVAARSSASTVFFISIAGQWQHRGQSLGQQIIRVGNVGR